MYNGFANCKTHHTLQIATQFMGIAYVGTFGLTLSDTVQPPEALSECLFVFILTTIVLHNSTEPGLKLLPPDIPLSSHRGIGKILCIINLLPFDYRRFCLFCKGGRFSTGIPSCGGGSRMASPTGRLWAGGIK